MYRLYLLLLILSASYVQPTTAQPVPNDSLLSRQDEPFTVVEQQPEFPGGRNALHRYIRRKNNYPEVARRAGVTGRVFVSFTINTDGSIQDVRLLKGIGFGCDEQAIRLVSHMPNWLPASQDGKPVRVKYNLPIAFGLPYPRPTSASRRQPPPEVYSCSFAQ